MRPRMSTTTNFTPEGVGNVSLTVYKCSLYDSHLYTKDTIPRLYNQLQEQLRTIINSIPDRQGLRKQSCIMKFPYLDYKNGNSIIRKDIESMKLCLLCISDHMNTHENTIIQECFYNEEEKESQ